MTMTNSTGVENWNLWFPFILKAKLPGNFGDSIPKEMKQGFCPHFKVSHPKTWKVKTSGSLDLQIPEGMKRRFPDGVKLAVPLEVELEVPSDFTLYRDIPALWPKPLLLSGNPEFPTVEDPDVGPPDPVASKFTQLRRLYESGNKGALYSAFQLAQENGLCLPDWVYAGTTEAFVSLFYNAKGAGRHSKPINKLKDQFLHYVRYCIVEDAKKVLGNAPEELVNGLVEIVCQDYSKKSVDLKTILRSHQIVMRQLGDCENDVTRNAHFPTDFLLSINIDPEGFPIKTKSPFYSNDALKYIGDFKGKKASRD